MDDDLDHTDFWVAGPELDKVEVATADELDDEEAPALRRISRPAQWTAPAPPSSVLAAVYGSVRRRAREFLRTQPEGADENGAP